MILGKPNWFVSAVTDDRGEFDIPQMMVPVTVVAMIALQCYGLFKGQTFDPMNFGTGVAAVVAALGAYKWGDGKGREAAAPAPGASTTLVQTDQGMIATATGPPLEAEETPRATSSKKARRADAR